MEEEEEEEEEEETREQQLMTVAYHSRLFTQGLRPN
jgi:hypothetical protein